MLKKLLAMCLLCVSALSWAAVDANSATEADLTQVKGIGPAIATQIVEARKQGNFKDWPDLIARVKGVGQKNADKFSQGGLTVNGQSIQAPATTTAAAPAAPATQTSQAATAQKK